jgi:hypothetical protein
MPYNSRTYGDRNDSRRLEMVKTVSQTQFLRPRDSLFCKQRWLNPLFPGIMGTPDVMLALPGVHHKDFFSVLFFLPAVNEGRIDFIPCLWRHGF